MKDKGYILIIVLLFSLGVVSGMIIQQHNGDDSANTNRNVWTKLKKLKWKITTLELYLVLRQK